MDIILLLCRRTNGWTTEQVQKVLEKNNVNPYTIVRGVGSGMMIINCSVAVYRKLFSDWKYGNIPEFDSVGPDARLKAL